MGCVTTLEFPHPAMYRACFHPDLNRTSSECRRSSSPALCHVGRKKCPHLPFSVYPFQETSRSRLQHESLCSFNINGISLPARRYFRSKIICSNIEPGTNKSVRGGGGCGAKPWGAGSISFFRNRSRQNMCSASTGHAAGLECIEKMENGNVLQATQRVGTPAPPPHPRTKQEGVFM